MLLDALSQHHVAVGVADRIKIASFRDTFSTKTTACPACNWPHQSKHQASAQDARNDTGGVDALGNVGGCMVSMQRDVVDLDVNLVAWRGQGGQGPLGLP